VGRSALIVLAALALLLPSCRLVFGGRGTRDRVQGPGPEQFDAQATPIDTGASSGDAAARPPSR
jgi:hypothetical protein